MIIFAAYNGNDNRIVGQNAEESTMLKYLHGCFETL